MPLRSYRYCKRGSNRQWRTRLMEMAANILGLTSFLIKYGQSRVFQRADAWLAFLPANFQYSLLGFNNPKILCLRSSNVQDSDRNLPPYLSSNRHVAVKYRPTVIMTKILNEQLKEPKKQTNSNQSNRLWNPVEPSIEISPFTLKNLQLYCQIPLLSDHYCNSTTAS